MKTTILFCLGILFGASLAISTVNDRADKTSPLVNKCVDNDIKDFLRAVHWVESRNGTDPDCYSIGKSGELGPYQITPGVIKDLQNAGYSYRQADRLDPVLAAEMAVLYTDLWGAVSTEERCRCFHRGPRTARWWDDAGDVYWNECLKGMRQ